MLARRNAVKIVEAANEVMEASYLTASADGEGGRLPVKPRQIMYVARPSILKRTGRQTFNRRLFHAGRCWSPSCGNTRP